MADNYSAKEHDGLRKDGQPDKRLSSEHGFGGDRDRASEMGKKGGATQVCRKVLFSFPDFVNMFSSFSPMRSTSPANTMVLYKEYLHCQLMIYTNLLCRLEARWK